MVTETLDIKGAINSREETELSSLAERVSGVFVEIGSWKGHSASIIGAVAKRTGGHLYCVDHWKEDGIYNTFEHNLNTLGLRDYVTPIIMDSLTAVNKFADESIDFLFIDADHRYEPFVSDLKAWYPKVKKGGIICGHDCEMIYSSSSPFNKERVRWRLEMDFDGCHHCGVIKGLFDYFNDDYKLAEGTRIWSKIK